jgi:putative nucleotidyltransferase with HDIG domain
MDTSMNIEQPACRPAPPAVAAAARVSVAQEKTLQRLQQRINQLPLLPKVVVTLMNLDPHADDYFERVVAMLRADPAFAAKLLRYANSAMVSPQQPVVTLEQALQLVGCQGAVGLIFLSSATKVFVPHHEWERNLWRHALDVACIMRALAPRVAGAALDPERAYLFGLLHDIGRFVMYLEAPDELRMVEETEWDSPQSMIEAETSICGYTHAELGYLALTKWDLPARLADVVRYHHQPDAGCHRLTTADVLLVRLMQDADWISIKLGMNSGLWNALPLDTIRSLLMPPRLKSKIHLMPIEIAIAIRNAFAECDDIKRTLGLLPEMAGP